MNELLSFKDLSPMSLADVVTRDWVMNCNIHPLWVGNTPGILTFLMNSQAS